MVAGARIAEHRARWVISAALLVAAGLAATALTVPSADPADISLQQQPTWPYHWLPLLQQLAADDDFSPAFDRALANAAHFGPAERQLRPRLAVLGLKHWDRMSPHARDLTVANIDFALQTQPEALLKSAFVLRREALVCARPAAVGTLKTVCERFRGLRAQCDAPNPGVERLSWCLQLGAVPASTEGETDRR